MVADGTADVFRSADGLRLRHIEASDAIQCAAWHPDGRTLALGSRNRILLWDLESNQETCALLGHEGQLIGLEFTTTGEWLGSASWDLSTRLWQTDAAREVLRLPRSGSEMTMNSALGKLAFKSPDLSLYEFAVPRIVQRYTVPPPADTDPFTALATFSPDGEIVAVIDPSGIYLFQPPDPKPIALLPGEMGYRVVFQADQRALLTCGSNGLMRWPMEWSADRTALRLGPPEPITPNHRKPIGIFLVSADGQLFLVQTKTGYEAFTCGPRSLTIQTEPAVLPGQVPYLSPDGNYAASIAATRPPTVQVWNPRTGSLVTNLPGVREVEMAFSPDNRWLAYAQNDATVFWSTADWTPRVRVPHLPETPGRYRIGFSPDSQIAAVSVGDRQTRLVRVATGEELATLPMDRLLNSLVFSPDGLHLASTQQPGHFQIWNLHQLRSELATRGLDWPGPSLPATKTRYPRPRIRVTVLPGKSPVANASSIAPK